MPPDAILTQNPEFAGPGSTMWLAWVDGTARPNPGRIGIGHVLVSPSGLRAEHSDTDGRSARSSGESRTNASTSCACFQRCDVIAGPVAPTVARPIATTSGSQTDPVAEYLADIFTLPASLAGLPGMSVPAGFGEQGLPVGLQLVGNYWQEAQLLHTAHAFQQATDWHTRKPTALA